LAQYRLNLFLHNNGIRKSISVKVHDHPLLDATLALIQFQALRVFVGKRWKSCCYWYWRYNTFYQGNTLSTETLMYAAPPKLSHLFMG